MKNIMAPQMNSKRDTTLDIVKGIGILTVVFAHIYMGKLSTIVYTFHMPLFFIASGCLFAIGKGGTIKGKVKSLIIPYTIFSILSFLYWWLIELHFRAFPKGNPFEDLLSGVDPIILHAINIPLAIGGPHSFVYNVVLWFLPCLFISYLIYIPISKCKPIIQTLIGAGLLLIFYILHMFINVMPWYADIALLAVPFFVIGKYGYIYLNNQVKSTKWAVIFFIVSCLIFSAIYYSTDVELNLKERVLPPVCLLYSVPVLGFIMVWCVAYIIKTHGWRLKEIFVWLGTNSLLIMLLHEPINRISFNIFWKLTHYNTKDLMREDLFISILITFTVILICFPIASIITKKLPWMIGKLKTKTVNKQVQ